jgi:hypothetical protein
MTTATPVDPLGDSMRVDRYDVRHVTFMTSLVVCLTMVPAVSRAFTEADQRRLCTGDVLRLCASEIPDVDRITACMHKQRASLSEGCRKVFGKPSDQSASAK